MYFINLIQKKYAKKNLEIYFDMDGVITDYDFGNYDFLHKRPLKHNLKVLEKLNGEENVNVHILSICKVNSDIQDKKTWLLKYAPYLKDKNIHIISKESKPNKSSRELKCEYLAQVKTANKIILIDDDNEILKYIHQNLPDIELYQDSSMQE